MLGGHFFNFDIWKQTSFAKCSAAKRLSDQRTKTALRAKWRARKRQLSVTGKMPFFEFCP